MKNIIGKIKGMKKKNIIITAVIAAIIVSGGIFTYYKLAGKSAKANAQYSASVVQRGDVSVTISGSGTVEPVSRFDIISLVKGEILSCDYEEGNAVKQGDVLYRIDSTDLQNNIQKQHNNITKQQLTAKTNAENVAGCKVRATASGTLTDFTIKVNDTARAEKVATIVNSNSLVATVPFNSAQLSQISLGDSATVTSALYMTTISGTVTYKSNAASSSSDGSILYNVEITVKNPGSLAEGVSVGATVHTSGGDVKSPASGKLENGGAVSVIPKVSGKVTKVFVKNNQYVNEGDVLFQIDDTEYALAQTRTNIELADLQLSLQSYTKELDNYNITSPIDGVVISKTYKVGDTIGNSQNSSASLMTVADTSKMVFNLDVDELEISKVTTGQTAKITADALPNASFTGTVTKIAKEGTSSNGVTTYKVELTISEPGNLISGMNVNAEIIVEESKDALYLPISAVSGLRDNQGFVLVKDSYVSEEMPQGQRQQRVPDSVTQGERPQRSADGAAQGERPQRQSGMAGQSGDTGMPQQRAASGFANFGVPEGYKRIRVTTGLSNSDIIEIKSGLKEGDEVFTASTSTKSSASTGMQGRTNVRVGGFSGGGSFGGPPGGGR